MTREASAVMVAALLGLAAPLERQPYEYLPLPPEKPPVVRNRAERRKKPVRRLR